ncbi:hypothetical protein LTR74_018359 [Friedmanniomyces endolithicus]|nr:hypothetical protein LTR74_018359 [Friedmanniomyces endolithicus]
MLDQNIGEVHEALVAIATWLIWLEVGVSGTLPPTCLDIETGGWPLSSLQSAIAVFVIACPLGMGLSTPTALFVGGGLTEKHGILLKRGREAFEEASRQDIAVFDKTGTLTQGGDPEVTDYPFSLLQESALNEQQLLSALKHLEANGSHPIGKAVVDFCQVTPATGTKAQHIEEGVGKGIQGSFTVTHPTSATLDSWKGQAKSVVIVATIGISPSQTDIWEAAMILAVFDAIRPESRFLVESLSQQGVDIWMLSGDNPTSACTVCAMIGIPYDQQRRTCAGGSLTAITDTVPAEIWEGICCDPGLSMTDLIHVSVTSRALRAVVHNSKTLRQGFYLKGCPKLGTDNHHLNELLFARGTSATLCDDLPAICRTCTDGMFSSMLLFQPPAASVTSEIDQLDKRGRNEKCIMVDCAAGVKVFDMCEAWQAQQPQIEAGVVYGVAIVIEPCAMVEAEAAT